MAESKSLFGHSLIIVIISALILPLIYWKLTTDRPDLKFYLSGAVSTMESSGGSPGVIQELNVINKGTKAADKIILKLSSISDYKLIPFSETDKYVSSLKNGELEIKYPTLTPSGSFKVIINNHFGVMESSVNLYHSEGTGQNLFGKGIFDSSTPNVFIIYLFGVIIISTIGGISLKNSFFCGKAEYQPKYVLEKDKPLFLGIKRWREVRKTAIDNIIREEFAYDVDQLLKSNSYKTSNNCNDFDLNTKEAERILSNSIAKLESLILSILGNICLSRTEFERIGTLERPINFPEGRWEKICHEINNRYKKMVLDSIVYTSFRATFPKIEKDKPSYINKKTWEEIIEVVTSLELIESIKDALTPNTSLDNIDAKEFFFLSVEKIKEIKALAYEYKINNSFDISRLYEVDFAERFLKQDNKWIDSRRNSVFSAVASKTLETKLNNQKCDWILRQMLLLLDNRPVVEKPEFIDIELYEKIKSIENEIHIKRKELSNLDIQLQKERINILEKNEHSNKRAAYIKDFMGGVEFSFEELKQYFTLDEFQSLKRFKTQ